jgi:UDP:flavonoid glycosyltransferase YjiC (YdhE family)
MPFGGDQPINAQHIENKGVGLQVRGCGYSRGETVKGKQHIEKASTQQQHQEKGHGTADEGR